MRKEIDPSEGSLVPYLEIGADIIDATDRLIADKYRLDVPATVNAYCDLCRLFPDQFEVGEGVDAKLVNILEWERLVLQDFIVEEVSSYPLIEGSTEDKMAIAANLGGLASVAYMRNVLFVDECIYSSKGIVFMDCNTDLTDEDVRQRFFPKDNLQRTLLDYVRYQKTNPDLFRAVRSNAVSETHLMIEEYGDHEGPFIMPAKFARILEDRVRVKFFRAAYILLKREELTFDPTDLLRLPDHL